MLCIRRVVTGVVGALALGWLALVAVAFFAQRALVFPAPRVVLPVSAAQLVELPHTVLLVRPPPSPDALWVLHFHGNAEQLGSVAWMADAWHAQGVGFVAVEYPGYGLAREKGAPGEASIVEAALDAVRHLQGPMGITTDRLIVSGQSLGSGVAVALAARGTGSRLLLFTPFTSLPDVGARAMPFLPVRLLMRDRFDSLSRAGEVRQPVLIVHGSDDEVVPFELGARLASALPNATLLRIAGGRHNDVAGRAEVWRALGAFVTAP